MKNQFQSPDPETRARSIANLREAGRLLDLWTLELDEGLRAQRQARLLAKSKSVPASKIES